MNNLLENIAKCFSKSTCCFICWVVTFMMLYIYDSYGQDTSLHSIPDTTIFRNDRISEELQFRGEEINSTVATFETEKPDSTTFNENITQLKEDFQRDLEGSLNGLVLADLDKDDLSHRVDILIDSYRNNESYQKVADYDQNLDSKLESFGKEEVTTEWLENRTNYAKIFNEYPKDIYEDRIALKQDLQDLEDLSHHKTDLIENWDLEESILNDYHKYLKGQKSLEGLESDLKILESSPSRKGSKKHTKFLKEIKSIDTREKQIQDKIRQNKYVNYLEKETGEDFKSLLEDNPEEKDFVLNRLRAEMEGENIQEVLNNDFVFDFINSQQPNVGTVGGGVIKKEVQQVLDSIDGNLLKEKTSSIKDSTRVAKNEVNDLILKDDNKNNILPKDLFFEGIIAFAKSSDQSVFSLSPNIGKRFNNGISGGFGLTLHHNNLDNASIQTALDYKAFLKYEFIKKMFFIQSEYIAMIPGISYLKTSEEGVSKFNDTILVGGGFNIKLKGENALSLGLMYNLDQDLGLPTYQSPLLARFGIKLF